MNKVTKGLVVFLAVLMLILGSIFVIAGGLENVGTGGLLMLVGVGMLYYIYAHDKIEASKPTLVSQTFNVSMGGSGELKERQLKCRNCSAPVQEKDLRVVQGGIMMTCPYCGAVSSLEEEPKW